MTTLDASKWSLSKLPQLDAAMVMALRQLDEEVSAELCRGLGPELLAAYLQLPPLEISQVQLTEAVTAEWRTPPSIEVETQLRDALMKLAPWRKGPFQLGELFLDAEWRSDLKWQRLESHLPALEGKRVLDVGCGNGYYLYRMANLGADWVAGIDPFLRYFFQFAALQKYLAVERLSFMPVAFQRIPVLENYFDVLFCLGVLYHQRSPLDFLGQLRRFVRANGTVVIETLTIEGEGSVALFPRDRYAKMRNCYFLPTARCLLHWLERAGFRDMRVVDETPTTIQEQRATDWMTFESFSDFLDPDDPTRTIEGYPAPRRTSIIASA